MFGQKEVLHSFLNPNASFVMVSSEDELRHCQPLCDVVDVGRQVSGRYSKLQHMGCDMRRRVEAYER
jgi:hypothetical protein